MTTLQDTVVLIVGAGREPGPSIARALAAQGAIVALNDLSPVPLDPIVAAIQASGGRANSYVGDATRGMPLRAMIDEVLADWDRIDVLINNPRVQPLTPLMDMDEWDWQRTVEMNLNGPFLVTQLCAKLMREQGEGVVINIIESERYAADGPARAAYAASQAGLLALTRSAAKELMAYNIRVYGLCPDPVMLTNQESTIAFPPGNLSADSLSTGALSPDTQRSDVPSTDILPTPTTVSSSNPAPVPSGDVLTQKVVFLASQESRHFPGQILQVGAQEREQAANQPDYQEK